MKEKLFIALIFSAFIRNLYAEEILSSNKDFYPIVLKILNGEDADITDYLFLASLQIENKRHFCGASFIHKNWAVTAAHCVLDIDLKRYWFELRSDSDYHDKGGKIHKISKIVHHPRYNSTLPKHDIALLELEKPVDEKHIIPLAREEPPTWTQVTTLGWGKNQMGKLQNHLQTLNLTVLNINKCRRKYSKGILCMMNLDKIKRDVCIGDSGGPVIVNGKLLALISGGPTCKDARKFPGFYTSIPQYRRFIEKVSTSANNILLLHLGSLNILLGTLFLVFALPSLKGIEWVIQGVPCIIHGYLFNLLNPMVLWTICGLNCDRYYAIAAPLHYSHRVSPNKVLLGLGIGWSICVILSIPPIFHVAPYGYVPGLGACAPDFSKGIGTIFYATIYTTFTLLLPATIIVCCNLKILMIARYHRHRIASAIYEVTLSAQVTITHQRNPFFVPTVTAPSAGGPKFRGRSAIPTVFQMVGSFLILYIPYYCLIVFQSVIVTFNLDKNILKPCFYTLSTCLITLTLPVNSFLYGVKNKTLRKTFQNYWRKKQTKSEVNQEIQARTPSTCGSRRPSLTPLGFLTKPNLQRRLSETLLDKSINKSPQKSKIKRIASEITWRPASANSLNLSPKEEINKKITHTKSCNTLQVPSEDVSIIPEDEHYIKNRNKDHSNKPSPTNILLHKFFGIEHEKLNFKKAGAVLNVLEGTPKRSPRILITRAFSEESEKNSEKNSPTKEITKKHSSSANTLIERKWRLLRYKDEDSDSDGQKTGSTTMKPLLDNSSYSNRSSDSSETSESSGRIFMSLDKKNCEEIEANEDQLLLSWNRKKYKNSEDARKSRSNLLKQSLANMQNQEIVL